MALLFRHMVWEMVPRLMLGSMVMWCYFLYYNHFPWDPILEGMSPENFGKLVQEQSSVNIIPRADCSISWMNSVDFHPDDPAWTPVWIALYFREQRRCKLIPPSWLAREELWRIQDVERRSEMFSKMTMDRYVAMAPTIFEICPQDVLDGEDAKALVRNVFQARTSQLRNAKVKVVKEEDVTQAEMCAGPDRPFFPKALEELHQKPIRDAPIDGKIDSGPRGEVKVTYSVVTML